MADEKPAAPVAKKKEKKGKRVRTGRKHSTVEVKKFYTIEGGKITRNRRFCPRCGAGTFLAAHKARQYCGRCGYTEFDKKT